jgi:hypothetical protein
MPSLIADSPFPVQSWRPPWPQSPYASGSPQNLILQFQNMSNDGDCLRWHVSWREWLSPECPSPHLLVLLGAPASCLHLAVHHVLRQLIHQYRDGCLLPTAVTKLQLKSQLIDGQFKWLPESLQTLQMGWHSTEASIHLLNNCVLCFVYLWLLVILQ